jgi:hypothetical protein
LPPPVGTVSEKKPGWQGRLGTALAQDVGAQVLTGVSATGSAAMWASNAWCICASVGKAAAAGGFARVEVRLGVEKVGIHQAREQHAHPQAKPAAPPGICATTSPCARMSAGGWAARPLSAPVGHRALQSLFQPTIPIVQTRVVACNQVRQDMP